MSKQEYQQLVTISNGIGDRQIYIVNSCFYNSEEVIAKEIPGNGRVFVAHVSTDEVHFPIRQRTSYGEFYQAYLRAMQQKIINLTHCYLLDPKFYEYAPLINEESVLIIANADYVVDSARSAYSMHITSSFLDSTTQQIKDICIPAVNAIGNIVLPLGDKSVIYVRNFDLKKPNHADAFFGIRFRPAACTLGFLKNKFVPKITNIQFVHMLLRVCQALRDMLEGYNHIYGRVLSDYESIYIPEVFIQSLVKDYSLSIEILQYMPQYYDIFLKYCNLQPYEHIVSITQFIYLVSTYCDPAFYHQAELDEEVNDYRFYAPNSFHLAIQRYKPVYKDHGEVSLARSAAILKFLCSDPLVAVRYVLERFSKIIFVSSNIPFDYNTTDRFVETLSSKCRLNYFNRKSTSPLDTHFFNIDCQSDKFIRYQRKGADQTLLTTYYSQLTPQMALNYQNFIDQRCSQSRDGVIVCTPSRRFTSQLAQYLQLQNIPIARRYLAFFSSQDQASAINCTKQYKLCCDIGRGGVFVEDCATFQPPQFKNQYNSIALIIGVPFPVKSLQNKIRAFYEFSVRQQPADEYWCELAARNIVKIASGPQATILADMRYGKNSMVDLLKYFPPWFIHHLMEEGPQCLIELKNWVIQHGK